MNVTGNTRMAGHPGVFPAVPLYALLAAAFFLLGAPGAAAQAGGFSPELFLQVSSITEAGPPRVLEEAVIFTWEGPGFTRYVAAAFAHEGFQQLHPFVVRQREGRPDLFYLVYPVRPDMELLEYRLVVDGVWLVDPRAPQVRRDRMGVSLGQIPLLEPPVYRVTSPRPNGDGTVTFFFALDLRIAGSLETLDQRQISLENFPNPRITVAGSFNGWDPFAHRLHRSTGRPGFWEVTVPVPPGDHFYFFLIDGERVLDPINLQRARDRQTGARVSTFRHSPASP